MRDKDGTKLEAGDAVTFLLGGLVLTGIALHASGPYVTVAYNGLEYGIVSERVQKVTPDPE